MQNEGDLRQHTQKGGAATWQHWPVGESGRSGHVHSGGIRHVGRGRGGQSKEFAQKQSERNHGARPAARSSTLLATPKCHAETTARPRLFPELINVKTL